MNEPVYPDAPGRSIEMWRSCCDASQEWADAGRAQAVRRRKWLRVSGVLTYLVFVLALIAGLVWLV